MIVAHYTAADDLIDGDPGEYYDRLDEYMRSMQANYLSSRGYSLGYLWAVDWLGGAWEIRGWDYKSAANTGDERKTGVKNVNPMTAPILYLVDGNDGLTSLAARTGRALGAEAERRARRQLGRPRPHSALDFTACCGDGIRADIAAGRLDPGWTPVVTPPTRKYFNLGDITMTDPHRLYDSRVDGNQQPAGVFAIQTGVDPGANERVWLNVTTLAGDVAGHMCDAPDVSFNNFNPGDVRNTVLPVKLQADGTVHLWTSNGTPVHVVVDYRGSVARS